MKMNGTRARLVSLAHGEQVPIELTFGSQRIDVFIDHRGIHFRQENGSAAEGHLPWDLAIAMSLVPEAMRRRFPAA